MRCFRSCPAVFSFLFAALSFAQNQQEMPRDYRGVQIIVPGIFVTPVPNAPFSATVDILSHEALPDGSVDTRTTWRPSEWPPTRCSVTPGATSPSPL